MYESRFKENLQLPKPVSILHALGWEYLNLLPRVVELPLEWRGQMVLPPGRILFCFPEDYESFLKAWTVIREVGLERSRLLLAARRPYLHAVGKKGPEKRIPYEPGDINRFGLAKRSLLRKVRRTRPTMAVDLHTSSIPLGGHLCLRSGAKVRAGFRQEGARRVFNFLLRTSEDKPYEDRVLALFIYLGLAKSDRRQLEATLNSAMTESA